MIHFGMNGQWLKHKTNSLIRLKWLIFFGISIPLDTFLFIIFTAAKLMFWSLYPTLVAECCQLQFLKFIGFERDCPISQMLEIRLPDWPKIVNVYPVGLPDSLESSTRVILMFVVLFLALWRMLKTREAIQIRQKGSAPPLPTYIGVWFDVCLSCQRRTGRWESCWPGRRSREWEGLWRQYMFATVRERIISIKNASSIVHTEPLANCHSSVIHVYQITEEIFHAIASLAGDRTSTPQRSCDIHTGAAKIWCFWVRFVLGFVFKTHQDCWWGIV